MTIRWVMGLVLVTALALALFRMGSYWGLMGLIPFLLTIGIGLTGTGPLVRRPALWIAMAGTLVLPLLAAWVMNYLLWGYFIRRPEVDGRIVSARRFETATSVDTHQDGDGRRVFVGAPIEDLKSLDTANDPDDNYYLLTGRLVRALKERGALPAVLPEMSAERLKTLYSLLERTGRLEEGNAGYDLAKQLDGLVVEADGRDGRPLLYVGVRGREVSNDHYPFYEFLFTGESPDGPWTLASFERFYYDVAGMEGLEWPGFFPFLAIFAFVPTVVVQAVALWCWKRWRARPEWTRQATAAGRDGAR